MMANTFSEKHDFAAQINQFLDRIPSIGFDGLSDLLLLLNDLFSEEGGAELSNKKTGSLNSLFEMAEMHMQNAPNQQTINELITHIQSIAENLLLDGEDITLIRELLLLDQAPENFQIQETINSYQINQLTDRIPDTGFDGLRDLLLLLNELFSDEDEIEYSAETNNTLNSISEVAEMHLKNAPNQQTINELITHIQSIAENLLLDGEDITLIQELLLLDQVSTQKAFNNDKIKQLTDRIPDTGFDGLRDLLLLLNELFSKEDKIELPVEKTSSLKSIFEAAEMHLKNAPNQKTINELITHVQNISEDLFLDNEDIALFQELMALDQAHKNNHKPLKSLKKQLNFFQGQAKNQELNRLLDILYLLDEWLDENTQNQGLSVKSLSAYKNVLLAIQNNFLGNKPNEKVINTLISQVNEVSLLEQEDGNLLQNLLQKEDIQTKQIEPKSTEFDIVNIDSEEVNQGTSSVAEIPAHLEEYLDILINVFLPIETCLNKLHKALQEQSSISIIDAETLDDLKDDLQKFATISQTTEFVGLSQSIIHVQENQTFLSADETDIVAETITLFNQWGESIADYLKAPLSKEAIQRLLMANWTPSWPVAIEEGIAENLLIELQSLTNNDEEKVEVRQGIAKEEDVSLALPDDVASVLIDSLLEELPEQTALFSEAIEQLSQGGSINDVIVAQRVAHTLKGAGNTVGIIGIANLTHHLEDILTALADEGILPDKTILSTLQRASDCIEEMSETLIDNSPAPQDAVDVLQEILDVASRIDKQGISQIIKDNIAIQVSAFASEQNQQTEEPISEETKEESTEQMIRLPVSAIDTLLKSSDEIIMNNGRLRDYIKKISTENKLLHTHLEQFQQHSMKLLGLVDMQRIQQIQNQVVNTNHDAFDSLEMDQYNELYSASLRIHEMTSDSREMNKGVSIQLREVNSLLVEQGYLNSTSQADLLNLRTVPVQSIVSRLQRGMRQAVRMSGKKVELYINGKDLLVDRDVLNSVLEPLMHLLRNAIGHGIENSIERTKAGKPEQGTITISFRRDKNMIAIECIDDGGGLNLGSIKNKAIEKGLISKDFEPSDEEIKQLIMLPNFSTEETVNQISGRGVGMDAVNAGIRALGGTLQLASKEGKGCTFHIQVPLNLAHHNCLLINVGTQILAIAALGVEQVLLADTDNLHVENGEYTFIYDGNEYEIKTIESLLNKVQPNQKITMDERTFLLVKNQEQYFAIAVEQVKSSKELIVKDLDKVLPHIHGIIGASLLDDGSIAPVMDLQELLKEPSRWNKYTEEQFSEEREREQVSVMVVDDSLSARRSLEQFFSDMGYQIMAARDGLDAIEQLEKKAPNIIVTDMEMPRVNGIELTEHLRRTESTKDLPIIMITSRSTAKHKKIAKDKGVNEYLTKPYSENELSNTVLNLLSIE